MTGIKNSSADFLVGRQDLLRSLNYRAVIELIAREGPYSRVSIAHRLKLSQPSISRLVDELLRVRILKEGQRVASRVGRKQILLDINPEAGLVAGISVRPSGVRLYVADLKGKFLLHKAQTPKDRPDLLVQQIRQLLTEAKALVRMAAPIAAVSIGIAGVLDSESRLVQFTAPELSFLQSVELLPMLKAELMDVVLLESVQLENDVNFAALGEHAYGAAQGYETFFYLSLGSGIGGGVVLNGNLYRGSHNFAGEVGYLSAVSDPFRNLEARASRTALDDLARELKLGQNASDLFQLARSGDRRAGTVVRDICEYLKIALQAVIATLDPQLIVIGGSLGQYNDLLIPLLKQSLEGALPVLPAIVGTALDKDAALHGAVSQALQLARECLVRREFPQSA